jgi:hypothetical protein
LATTIFGLPISSFSQSDFRFDVNGSLGLGWYDSHDYGAFKNAGFGLGWRPFMKASSPLRGVGAEFQANYSWDISQGCCVKTQTIYNGAFLYHFSVRGTEPFVGLGFGGSDHTDCQGRSAPGNPPAVWTVQTSVGVKLPIGMHWYIRPQLDLFNGEFDSGGTRWFYRAGLAGVGYRF